MKFASRGRSLGRFLINLLRSGGASYLFAWWIDTDFGLRRAAGIRVPVRSTSDALIATAPVQTTNLRSCSLGIEER